MRSQLKDAQKRDSGLLVVDKGIFVHHSESELVCFPESLYVTLQRSRTDFIIREVDPVIL